jgi:hypothetical protein
MSAATFFIQECPTCGRRLQIRIEHLGKRVVCQHCQGKFVAMDPSSGRSDYVDRGTALIRRANELLDCADQRKVSHSPVRS